MSSLHWNGDERWTSKIHEKIGVGGGESMWNYPVSNVPNFLENGVILKSMIMLTPRDFKLMIWKFLLTGDNEIKRKIEYWNKFENKVLSEKVAWRKI